MIQTDCSYLCFRKGDCMENNIQTIQLNDSTLFFLVILGILWLIALKNEDSRFWVVVGIFFIFVGYVAFNVLGMI